MRGMMNAGFTLATLGLVLCGIFTAATIYFAFEGKDGSAVAAAGAFAVLGGVLVTAGLQIASMAYSKHRLDQIRSELDEVRRGGA